MEPSLVDGGASPLRTGAVVCLAQVVDGVTYRLRSSRCCQLGCSFAPARDGFREDFQFRVVAARSFPAASARRRPPRHGGEAGESGAAPRPLRFGDRVALERARGGGFLAEGVDASDASPECLGLTFVDGAAPGGRATFSLAPVYRSQRDGAAVTDGEEVLLVSRGKFRLSAEAVGLPGGGVAREAVLRPQGARPRPLDGTRLALVPPAPRAGEGLRFRDGQALALFHEEHAQFLSADPRGPLRALRRAFLGGAEPRGDYGRPLLRSAGPDKDADAAGREIFVVETADEGGAVGANGSCRLRHVASGLALAAGAGGAAALAAGGAAAELAFADQSGGGGFPDVCVALRSVAANLWLGAGGAGVAEFGGLPHRSRVAFGALRP